MKISLEPIGEVKNNIKEPPREWSSVVSELVLKPEFSEAMEGLEEFSHIIVLFWMHRAFPQPGSWGKVHPKGRPELPLVGVFATRSPIRPNPIGMTVVRLLERQGNILKVMGLDALDGTPLLDIKPYIPKGDRISKTKLPDWVSKL